MNPYAKKTLHGPISVGLYEVGSSFFRQNNKRLSRIRMFDNASVYGFKIDQEINAQQLQYMTVNGFVERIELSVLNIQEERQNFMDLIKLISFAMLYRQFDSRMWDIVIGSELKTLWNRSNPSTLLGFETNTRDQKIQDSIKMHSKEIFTFKQNIFSNIQKHIVGSSNGDADENKLKLYLAIRYLNMVNPIFWLLLTVFQDHEASRNLTAGLEHTLNEFIQRTDSPEYLALVMVEMLLLIKQILSSNKYITNNSNSLIDEGVQVSIRFSAKKFKQREHTRMHITITVGNREFDELRRQVNEKAHISFKKENLNSFLNSKVFTESQSMSVFYLSYLSDACKQMNIAFDSFVNTCPTTFQRLLNLVLTF